MKKLKQMVAVLSIGFLIPSLVHAESPSSDSVTPSPTIDQVLQDRRDTIPLIKGPMSLKSGPEAALTDSMQRSKAIQSKLAESEEQLKLRKEVEGFRQELDRLKVLKAIPSIAMNNAMQNRARKNEGLKQLFSLPNAAGNMVAGAMINTNNLEASCKANVDFDQFKQFSQMMQQQPVQALMQAGHALEQERDEKAKKDKMQGLQDLAKKFEEAANAPDPTENLTGPPSKKQIESKAFLEMIKGKQKSEIAEARNELVKEVFTKMIPKLNELREGDKELQQMATNFKTQIEQFKLLAIEAAKNGAEQLHTNCQGIVDRITGSRMDKVNVNSAFRVISNHFEGAANRATELPKYQTALRNLRNGLQCNDVTSRLDAAFGPASPLQMALNKLTDIQDPSTLVTAAMNTLQFMSQAQSQVTNEIRPLMNECNYAAKSEKKLQDLVASAQAADQGPMQGAASRYQGALPMNRRAGLGFRQHQGQP